MMTAFTRTLILYFLIMLGLRLMGKRQIGELEPSELVLTMMISDLATVPMQDFGIPLLAGVIPILTLLALSMLLSQLSLYNLRFRELTCGTPAVLIRHGELQQKTMQKNRYTLDELLEELPENCRTIFLLYYGEGFHTKEIAQILEMNENTVKSRLKRGRKKLEQVLCF